MSFDKWLGISRNKKREKRKKYRGAKAVDYSCRNHGSCDWCRSNRIHSFTKSKQEADSKLDEYSKDE